VNFKTSEEIGRQNALDDVLMIQGREMKGKKEGNSNRIVGEDVEVGESWRYRIPVSRARRVSNEKKLIFG